MPVAVRGEPLHEREAAPHLEPGDPGPQGRQLVGDRLAGRDPAGELDERLNLLAHLGPIRANVPGNMGLWKLWWSGGRVLGHGVPTADRNDLAGDVRPVQPITVGMSARSLRSAGARARPPEHRAALTAELEEHVMNGALA